MATSSEDAESQDALQKWGYMIKSDKRPSPNLDRLLRGIAALISSQFGQTDNYDLTPVQLACFYKAVGGNYDSLFLDMPAHSIAHIYRVLGCLHSLQPIDSDGHNAPTIPALKPKGFVRWQTIQILLGPEEHVPFIQNALRQYDILDPDTGFTLSKFLPASAFPSEPDPDMVTWHQSVSERLRREAEQGDQLHIDGGDDRSSAELSVERSIEERTNAAQYFSNPFNRNREGKPGIVRQIQQAPAKVFQGGKMVATTVFQGGKSVLDPMLFSRRKSSMSNRSASAEPATDRRHPSGHSQNYPTIQDRPTPPPVRHVSGPRRSPRRYRSPSTSSSDSGAERYAPRNMRRYRSNDSPPRSSSHQPGYKDTTQDRSSGSRGRAAKLAENPPTYPEFRPSGSPPMAARMAQPLLRRPSMMQRTNSEHRSFYDQNHAMRHRHNTVEGVSRPVDQHRSPSNSRYSRGHPQSQQYQQPQQSQYPQPRAVDLNQTRNGGGGAGGGGESLKPDLSGQTPEGRPQARRMGDSDRDVYDSDRRDSSRPFQHLPAVNGVGGRKYPKEAPWQ